MDEIKAAARAGLRKAKRYPVLYRLWYLLYRRNTGVPLKWFSAGTQLYVDGYPRSGNTFAQFLIKNLWPGIEFVHHFHAIAPLKIALNRHVPTFVLFRHPAASISSNYLKTFALRGSTNTAQIASNPGLLTELTRTYREYYDFVSRNTDDLMLIDFDSLISEPASVMVCINRKIPEELRLQHELINQRVNEVKDREFGARDPLGSSKPSPDKERAKNTLIDAIGRLDDYGRCLELHETLKDSSRAQLAKYGRIENAGDG